MRHNFNSEDHNIITTLNEVKKTIKDDTQNTCLTDDLDFLYIFL